MANRQDDIERYRNESMSESERHALEKKALRDPFLADALEGAESVKSEAFSTDLSELSEKLEKRHTLSWFSPLGVAAGVILLIGAGALIYYFNLTEPSSLALEKKSSDSSGNADSLSAMKTDSSSTLLTMAEPEETKDNNRKSLRRPSLTTSTETGPSVLDTTVAAGGAGAIQHTQTQPIVSEKSEEEKLNIAEAEISADKKEFKDEIVQSLPAPAAGAEVDNKKKSLSERSSLSKTAINNLPTYTFSGKVTATDGATLPGVNVLVKGSHEGTVTDASGNFKLNTSTEDPRLVFSFIGLETREIKITSNTPLQVQMAPDLKQLSEVVVVGYGIGAEEEIGNDKLVFELASPNGGMTAFKKYLVTSLRYPPRALINKTEGKVTVQFTVAPDGRPLNFTVIKGIGDGCDEELIRLIQEGPHWSPSQRGKIAFEDQVKIRLRFSLPR